MRKSLPPEVVAEILSWLPVKYVFQFRCVSRAWLQLLKYDPHFINLHIKHSIQANNPNNIMLVRKHDGTEKVHFYHTESTPTSKNNNAIKELEFPVHLSSCEYYFVAGIRNGLLCLAYEYDKNCFDLCIWNPFTKEHITISCPPILSYWLSINDKFITFGFGFHKGSNEYKVLRMISDFTTSDYKTCVSVYTLGGTGLWKTLDDISYMISRRSVLVSGYLHWLASRPFDFNRQVIVSFSIKDEVFQEMSLPKGLKSDLQVWELGGSLCISLTLTLSFEKEFEVWVMKDYGVVGSWTKLFKVRRSEIGGKFLNLQPVGVANGGEVILKKNESMRMLKKCGFHSFEAYTYIQSFVSSKVINGISQSVRSLI